MVDQRLGYESDPKLALRQKRWSMCDNGAGTFEPETVCQNHLRHSTSAQSDHGTLNKFSIIPLSYRQL